MNKANFYLSRRFAIGLLLALCTPLFAVAQQDRSDYTNGQGKTYLGDGMVSWVDGESWTNWSDEREKRERALQRYLGETDNKLSKSWGFRQDDYESYNPAVAWKWFQESPVGFGGIPFVVLKTIIDLDADNCQAKDYDLCEIAEIWQRPATVTKGLNDKERNNLDHLGFGPHPDDYKNGVAVAPERRRWPLPYGLVFQSGDPKYGDDGGPYFESIDTLESSTYESESLPEKGEAKLLSKLGPSAKRKYLQGILTAKRTAPLINLGLAKLAGKMSLGHFLSFDEGSKDPEVEHAKDYQDNYAAFGKSTGFDRVFFSCASCHVGRVLVDKPGAPVRVIHLPGSPNTEVEVQYFSRLLMLTGSQLVEGGLKLSSTELIDRKEIKPNKEVITGLYLAMLDKVLNDPGSFYGTSKAQKLRAEYMVWRAAWNYPAIAQDLIGTAVKTHYIYYVVAANNGYNVEKQIKAGRITHASQMPDVMSNRIGQMDAFGIASGLVALHSKRPDESFIRFIYNDVRDENVPVLGKKPGASPVFTGFPDMSGTLFEDLSGRPLAEQITLAGNRVFDGVSQWAPPVAAPIDVNSLFFSRDRAFANWDGNQGASARTLASGTSASGDPRIVNVQIHEPLNPFINNLPPTPYQWDVNVDRARVGRALFFGESTIGDKKVRCSGCHKPGNRTIFPANARKVNVDESRALTNNSVSRNMLAALVLEACTIYRNNNPDKPGNDYCMPEGKVQEEKLEDYFADVGARVENKRHGYKADMLHGIWARAPYLHNGSVPTLGALICPPARPSVFKRGIINYDQNMLGFEWQNAPKTRYNSKYETISFKEYDTRMLSRKNTGHEFGSHLCPDLSGLDPVSDRQEITKRILASPAGDLLEYLKTL